MALFSNARGVMAGLTRYVTAAHIARATLEATAYQSREVVEAMDADSGVKLESRQSLLELKKPGAETGMLVKLQYRPN